MVTRNLSGQTISNLFDYLEIHDQYVFLDTSKPDQQNRQTLLFVQPIEQLQYRSGEDQTVFLEQLSLRLNNGYYLAGWFSYEFLHGLLLDQKPAAGSLLADLGVYEDVMTFDHLEGEGNLPVPGEGSKTNRNGSYSLENLLPSMEKEEYCRAIDTILDYIAAGDTYQVNYTFKFSFDFKGSISSFYRELRRSQPVPYGCCLKNGKSHIMSFSPELFFRVEKGKILAKPMKGTMKRGRNGHEDDNHSNFLQNDVKNRSENVMIVDLLRNDLSRLVDATGGGTVNVASLFDIERYRSVFQMTSTVVADRFGNKELTPNEILQAIFPCGSVTGAPKLRTMEIIDELEKEKRGVYTGAIGYFSPTQGAVFNVPIRTIVLDGDKGEMGIGSGIVADSLPEQEWEECLLKAGFLTNPFADFKLIETMYYHYRDGCLYLEEHLDRLEASADYFDFLYSREKVVSELNCFCQSASIDSGYRVRMLLSRDGSPEFTSVPCGPPGSLQLPVGENYDAADSVVVGFADEPIDSSNPGFFHKTTMRKQYDAAYENALSSGFFDLIFCNEKNQVTEGCISNLIIMKDGCYYTPPLMCGLLDGVMRRHLLSENTDIHVTEKVLSRDDVLAADQLFVCNSVRGVLKARFVKR